MTALFLAADGGNSKTDIAIGTADGELLGTVRGPTCSPHQIGLTDGVRVLGELVRAVRAKAGLGSQTRIDLAAFYLAGADLPSEVTDLERAIGREGWSGRTIVDNDCFALLRSGTVQPDAVVVVCGAGSNCVGLAADGRTARFPALGPLSGDWGGGHELAQYTLRKAVRGEDGRGRPTDLSIAVARHFGRPSVERVILDLHFGRLPMTAVHELTTVLFDVAAAGDPVATGLVAQQADEVLAQHRAAALRLGLLDQEHTLVLGGGILRARHPQLHELIVAGARWQAPKVEISVPTEPPIVGSALLALDALAGRRADPVMEKTLRAQRFQVQA